MQSDILTTKGFSSDFEAIQWSPVIKNRDGRIKIDFAPEFKSELKTKEKVIYIYFNFVKNSCLIGKSAGDFYQRMSAYLTRINSSEIKIKQDVEIEKDIEEGVEQEIEQDKENRPVKENRESPSSTDLSRRVTSSVSGNFLMDIKEHPEHFRVGILHRLTAEEDLDDCERRSIKCAQSVFQLYNQNGGGGGGSPHADEDSIVYAILKDEFGSITPAKYYPMKKQGNEITAELTPGILEEIQKRKREGENFCYVFKHLNKKRRYVGYSNDPLRRIQEHCRKAKKSKENSLKNRLKRKGNLFQNALGKSPSKFGFGLVHLKNAKKIKRTERKNYDLFEGIGEVERHVIERTESLSSQNGYNMNGGGGGPVGKPLSEKRLFQNKKNKYSYPAELPDSSDPSELFNRLFSFQQCKSPSQS